VHNHIGGRIHFLNATNSWVWG